VEGYSQKYDQNSIRLRVHKVAATDIPRRAIWSGVCAAAIVFAPAAATFVIHAGEARNFAEPCSQITSNGSVAIQCGNAPIGSPGNFIGGCANAYGQYQNCMAQLWGPPNSRPWR
jgi:hypothetical protein